MKKNKKKLRQQHNLRQVFEICGSLWLPCHVALSPDGSGHITADKRLTPCSRSPKLPSATSFIRKRYGQAEKTHADSILQTENKIVNLQERKKI